MSAYKSKCVISRRDIEVWRVANDVNGSPRYIVSWLSLGLPAYESTKLTRRLGLSKYRARWFGGGFVFQSYSLESDLEWFIAEIDKELNTNNPTHD